MSPRNVVAIGGGHGLAMTLRAVRTYAARTTAVVATGDDGGSSGRLRDHIDMPAPGDLRRCLTSLAADRVIAEALEHRFEDGDVAGHAAGNLLLAALVEQGMDLAAAAARLATWLGLDADEVDVLPSTIERVDLVADTRAGSVRGQVAVEAAGPIDLLSVDPPDPAVPELAIAAIGSADQIVLGPGSLYSSILAPAVVPAIRAALASSPAVLVYVANLRADEAGVKDFDVADHVAVLRRHGIEPGVVVTQRGALAPGDLSGLRHVEADVDRPHGLAHDSDLLGGVLGSL